MTRLALCCTLLLATCGSLRAEDLEAARVETGTTCCDQQTGNCPFTNWTGRHPSKRLANVQLAKVVPFAW